MKVPTNVTTETWARWLGFLAGILLIGVVVLSSRIPPGDGKASVDVLFVAGPTGELAVVPTGPVLAASGLLPGKTATGRMAVTNQTGKELRVGLRALPDSRELDELLRVRIRIRRSSVFEGSLREFRTAKTLFPIESGRTANLELTAWLPRSARLGRVGRVVSVPLELSTAVVA